MPYRFSEYLRPLFLTGDILILNLSFVVGYFLKFGNVTRVFEPPYFTIIIIANLVWLTIAFATQSYAFSRVTRVAKILRGLAVYIILHMLIITAFWVYERAYYYSREYLIYTYIVLSILLFIWRTGAIYLLRIYRKKGFNFRRIVIFGYGEVAEELRKFFLLHPESGYRFMGYFSNQEVGPRILGNFDAMTKYSSEHRIDEIYCCIPYVKYDQIQKLIGFGEENLIKVKLIGPLAILHRFAVITYPYFNLMLSDLLFDLKLNPPARVTAL